MLGRLMFFIAFLPAATYADTDYSREQIQKRISPIGQVHIQPMAEKTTDSQEMQEASPDVKDKLSDADIYDKYCRVCHQAGVAGAPEFRMEADWRPRLDKKGIAGLVTTAINGLNAMPPKGTCMACDEEDIKAAVEYMVPQS